MQFHNPASLMYNVTRLTFYKNYKTVKINHWRQLDISNSLTTIQRLSKGILTSDKPASEWPALESDESETENIKAIIFSKYFILKS